MRVFIYIWLYFVLTVSGSAQAFTINGTISDSATGESLIGAIAYVKGTTTGVSSNVYGFYSLSLPPGRIMLSFRFFGYKATEKEFTLQKDTTINIQLSPESRQLAEVIVTHDKDAEEEEIKSAQMGTIRLRMEKIKSIPAIGGETDIMKVLQLMPGVKRGDEGQTGMFVRGGDGDQNLILLDEATVYNVAHLFGFFSVFNTDVLNDISIVKGGFPASYGGRLSSVLDIRMKEGNMQKFGAEGGIGLLSSRLVLQGPLIKDKSSFILSGRRSYVDQVVKIANKADPTIPLLPYYFYDLNAKVNYRLSGRDRLYLSAYRGDDVLKFKADLENQLFNFSFILGNFTAAARWNHVYPSGKLFSNISLIHSRFRYNVDGRFVDNSVFIGSRIYDVGIKADYDFYPDTKNHIRYGGGMINHIFRPNVISTVGEISNVYKSSDGDLINTQEWNLFFQNEQSLGEKINLLYGIRGSMASTQGTLYGGIEPRFSAAYATGKKQSVKISYARMRQYMHLVSSSSIALPTDLWYPVTKKIGPQWSDQVSAGYNYHFSRAKTLLTVETYYKKMHNLIEYKEGAVLILNDNYENELVSGIGKAYGAELFISKTEGRLSGNIGYTISWTKRNFNELNRGNDFFAKYDRRHDLSIVFEYRLSQRLSVSALWVFASGSRLTIVEGQFIMPNVSLTNVDLLPIYSDKNEITLPASHRMDINFILKSKPDKRFHSEWHAGAYNVYNRAQPYRITVVETEKGGYKYQAVGLFGFIPSIAYNFKF